VGYVPVSDSVLEDLAKMAKAVGNLHEPSKSKEPDPKLKVTDYSTWGYSLTWSDGTMTGPGTAKNQMIDYLKELALQLNNSN